MTETPKEKNAAEAKNLADKAKQTAQEGLDTAKRAAEPLGNTTKQLLENPLRVLNMVNPITLIVLGSAALWGMFKGPKWLKATMGVTAGMFVLDSVFKSATGKTVFGANLQRIFGVYNKDNEYLGYKSPFEPGPPGVSYTPKTKANETIDQKTPDGIREKIKFAVSEAPEVHVAIRNIISANIPISDFLSYYQKLKNGHEETIATLSEIVKKDAAAMGITVDDVDQKELLKAYDSIITQIGKTKGKHMDAITYYNKGLKYLKTQVQTKGDMKIQDTLGVEAKLGWYDGTTDINDVDDIYAKSGVDQNKIKKISKSIKDKMQGTEKVELETALVAGYIASELTPNKFLLLQQAIESGNMASIKKYVKTMNDLLESRGIYDVKIPEDLVRFRQASGILLGEIYTAHRDSLPPAIQGEGPTQRAKKYLKSLGGSNLAVGNYVLTQ